MHLEQNLWQRALQVAKISFDSAGSEKVEAKIDALSMKKAVQLKDLLQVNSYKVEDRTEEKLDVKAPTKLSASDLMKLSLTSNHLEAFFIILGLSLNLLDDIKDAFQIDGWGIMESYAVQMASQTTLAISILIVAVALLSIFVSVIRTIIKFYNFTIEDISQGWKLTYGLINHQQKIIPFSKIQILSWRANWLRRKINFWIFTVQSIGHKIEKHKQHLQIPVTSLSGVLSLTGGYQQSPVFTTTEGLSIQPGYWKRKTLIVGVPITTILVTLVCLWIGLAGFSALLLLIYFWWYFRKWYSVFRWQINDEGLQVYTGVWGRQFKLLTWKKVQQIQLNQSSYQKRNQLASIIFITAGGSLKLPYIKFEEAKYLANLSLYYVESRNENWM
jgi:putative membrane protein